MPIYEYECIACGHQLEAIQKFSDNPLTECPECHKQSLQKLISAAGFQLKGTGWYATDFRNKGKSDTKSGKKEESSSDTSSGSSDTKPASSSDSGKAT